MCTNDLHVVIACAPTSEGQPDVCDIVAAFIQELQNVAHTKLDVTLHQLEDTKGVSP